MARRRTTTEPSLRIREFLALVHERVVATLGAEFRDLESRQRFGYVQYYRRCSAVHYEVWAQRKTGRVEIGLHFEGERDANYAAAAALAAHVDDITASICPEYELEEWTAQWTRLHRTIAAPALTPQIAYEAAESAAVLIRSMEPLIEGLGLRPC